MTLVSHILNPTKPTSSYNQSRSITMPSPKPLTLAFFTPSYPPPSTSRQIFRLPATAPPPLQGRFPGIVTRMWPSPRPMTVSTHWTPKPWKDYEPVNLFLGYGGSAHGQAKKKAIEEEVRRG
ncbi:hypothetical protein K504DRAFT_501612 [Pleomassaria siparia CBS 279.74]|uniref:Uncharacterized protein n=1 Tax=Pleomassaria siparia CBS 279.74 TaxID=1314801 RepID=A0A6G1KCT1_9PLEO|nr:hypothetical protein K504DRAFT_501612 [Pleomassaria siparia CBS 279.74]